MNARFSNPRRGLGSASFNPGIARAQAAGVTMSTTPYPTGDAGIQTSLAVVAKKIREGRHDPAINGWVAQVFKARGIDGRDHPSVRTQVGALLDELRSSVIYLPDAIGSEVIQSASATLCLAPGLCLNAGDCDDLTVALGAAALRAGIPVRAVHQIFYGAGTEHVLIQVQDERGKWLYADPSTRLPMGEAHRADKENYIDVMEGAPPELVTIGRPDHTRDAVTLGAASLPKSAAHTSHPPLRRACRRTVNFRAAVGGDGMGAHGEPFRSLRRAPRGEIRSRRRRGRSSPRRRRSSRHPAARP